MKRVDSTEVSHSCGWELPPSENRDTTAFLLFLCWLRRGASQPGSQAPSVNEERNSTLQTSCCPWSGKGLRSMLGWLEQLGVWEVTAGHP